jgi:hypothetical protein
MSRIKTVNPYTNITKKWLKSQFKEQDGKCCYSHIKMIITNKKRCLFKPSIERIDCSRPYTKGNCVLVLFGINMGRNAFPLKDYLRYIYTLRS